KPAVVLAESFGGAVGLLLALEHPELVERLVLVNTFAYFPERLKIRTGAIAARWFSEYLPGFVVKWVGGKVLCAPDLPREIRREFWARVADVPMGAVGRRVRMLPRLDLRSRLGEIQTPTLVFISPNDRVVRPRA